MKNDSCFATTTTTQGIRMLLTRCLDRRDQGHEAFMDKLFSTLREGEQLYAQPPEGWVSEHLRDAGKNICRASSKNMVSSSTSTKTFVSANSSRDPTHSVSKNLTTMTLFWTNFEQRRHRKLLGEFPWMDHPDIKNAVCQLSTHVGTTTSTTSRDEISIKRLLR